MKELTLGRRIQKLRRAQSLTQENLAERLDVTAQAVSKWENDLSCPDIMTLPQLCRELGVSIDTLLTGETVEMAPVQSKKKPEELIVRILFHAAEDGLRFNLNLPFTVFKLGARYGFLEMTYTAHDGEIRDIESAIKQLKSIGFESMVELIENGMYGKLFEYEDEGERLVIWTE